nr:EOG090X0LUS [Lepidurus arcticus]
MAETPDDELTIPRAAMNKMIKEIVPNVRVANEVRELILNCCTEFIHLIASEANEICAQQQKKTINAEHILSALDKLGFGDYKTEAETVLKDCKAVAAKKRRQSTRLENLGIPEEELLRQQQELFAKAREEQQQAEQAQWQQLQAEASQQMLQAGVSGLSSANDEEECFQASAVNGKSFKMSFSTLDVNITRQRLLVILGDDSKKYFSTLRAWFSLKLTKEDFDREAKKLIPPNLVHLHNDFLLAILGKCQSLCRQAVPRPSNLFTTQDIKPQIDQTDVEIKPRIIHQTPVKMEIDPEPVQIIPIVKERPVKPKVKLNRHQPLDPIDVLKAIKFPVNKVSARNNPVLSYCHRDLMLPDTAMIHGRMMVIAWEYGLDGVSDNAVELLILAVQVQKNLFRIVL